MSSALAPPRHPPCGPPAQPREEPDLWVEPGTAPGRWGSQTPTLLPTLQIEHLLGSPILQMVQPRPSGPSLKSSMPTTPHGVSGQDVDPAPHFSGGPGPHGACQARQLYLRLLSVTCRSPGAGPEMPTSSSSSSATGEWQLSPVPWAGVLRVACGTSASLFISTKDSTLPGRRHGGPTSPEEKLGLPHRQEETRAPPRRDRGPTPPGHGRQGLEKLSHKPSF